MRAVFFDEAKGILVGELIGSGFGTKVTKELLGDVAPSPYVQNQAPKNLLYYLQNAPLSVAKTTAKTVLQPAGNFVEGKMYRWRFRVGLTPPKVVALSVFQNILSRHLHGHTKRVIRLHKMSVNLSLEATPKLVWHIFRKKDF